MTAIEMAREWKFVLAEMMDRLKEVSDGVHCREQIDPLMIEIAHHYQAQTSEIDAKDADIAELVECLCDCESVMGPLAKEPKVNPWLVDVRRLIAKHRPDAFAKWADGIDI